MESNDYFSVESCSWDLTMNMATNVFGKLFLSMSSCSFWEKIEKFHNKFYGNVNFEKCVPRKYEQFVEHDARSD